jgi:c-di-GMP-binding flagellar brake protein YcgR
MFFIAGACFLALLSITLFMLWAYEKLTNKKTIPHAKIEECWPNEERRRHPRFEKDLEVEYNVEKKPRLKRDKTVNISKGGMKLLLDEKLPQGAIIYLKLYIPEKNRTVEAEAEVVWTKDVEGKHPSGKRFFHSGIKFITIKEPSSIHFWEYMNSLEING